MRTEVSLEEVIRQLTEVNPKDYFNKTELKEIFKTSKNFKLDVGQEGKFLYSSDDPDKMVIRIMFDWEACPHPEKFGYDQTWYLDLNKYISNKRKNNIKNILK